jgi:hypothetical protein
VRDDGTQFVKLLNIADASGDILFTAQIIQRTVRYGPWDRVMLEILGS